MIVCFLVGLFDYFVKCFDQHIILLLHAGSCLCILTTAACIERVFQIVSHARHFSHVGNGFAFVVEFYIVAGRSQRSLFRHHNHIVLDKCYLTVVFKRHRLLAKFVAHLLAVFDYLVDMLRELYLGAKCVHNGNTLLDQFTAFTLPPADSVGSRCAAEPTGQLRQCFVNLLACVAYFVYADSGRDIYRYFVVEIEFEFQCFHSYAWFD
nr:MAG TPA: hypothetical protein [Caudoviricetes sp.]